MNDLSLPSRVFPCLFLLTALELTGCGASRAYESSAPAAAPVDEARDSEEEDSAGTASGGDGERVEAPAEAQSTPSEDEAAEGDLDPTAEQDAARLDSAPSPDTGTEKTKKVRLVSDLHAELQALDESLHPERLSCEGAKPHQDAICSIATRICEMEQPSTTTSRDCKQAKKSCKRAKQRYEEECS